MKDQKPNTESFPYDFHESNPEHQAVAMMFPYDVWRIVRIVRYVQLTDRRFGVEIDNLRVKYTGKE